MGRVILALFVLVGIIVFIGKTIPSSPNSNHNVGSIDSAFVDSIRNIPPQWQVHVDSSLMDGTTTYVMSKDAEGEVQGWLAEERPTLFLRCRENKTDVFVRTGMSANPELGKFQEATVRLRYDNGKPITETWGESTDNEALFSRAPIPTARRLARAKTFLFEFTPFNASRVVVQFRTEGLSHQLPELALTCGWKI